MSNNLLAMTALELAETFKSGEASPVVTGRERLRPKPAIRRDSEFRI